MRLFELPALAETREANNSARYQALGISAEYLLAARLLELGHKVAVPVTDDDGVDLIVNYGTLVQVKSSSHRRPDGNLRLTLNNRRSSERVRRTDKSAIAGHVDIVAVYARDSRTWWFIPNDKPRTIIELNEMRTADPWREDWLIFDRIGGGTPAVEDA